MFAARGIALRAPDLAAFAPASLAHDAAIPAAGGDDPLGEAVAEVRGLIADLPRPRALIGASLGGLLAMRCADAADALVLVNPLIPQPSAPPRDWPDVVPWRREARLASTRRAMPDADDASALFAFRRWRDMRGDVLRAARASEMPPPPACPVLCVASRRDDDAPSQTTAALARTWRATWIEAASDSHVGPLLGRCAVDVAAAAASWLSAR